MASIFIGASAAASTAMCKTPKEGNCTSSLLSSAFLPSWQYRNAKFVSKFRRGSHVVQTRAVAKELYFNKDGATMKKLQCIQTAWTRRSSKERATKGNRKSWGQRVDKYMHPFMLDIMVSRQYVGAKVMHRVTSKVVSVATTSAKDLRLSLPSLVDANACKTVGELIAERSKDADVFAVRYDPPRHIKLEGKVALILQTITENDIALI